MQTSAHFGEKTSDFSKFMMRALGQGEGQVSVDILRTRGQ